jgi:hypothetical protein
MKEEVLRSVWEDVSSGSEPMPRNELDEMLNRKINETLNRVYAVLGISAAVSLTVIILLVKATIDMRTDVLYVWNNVLLGAVTLFSLGSALYSRYMLSRNSYAVSVKERVEKDIEMISRSLSGRYRNISLAVIPVIYILLFFSIHTYFSGTTMADVFNSDESVVAIVAGLVAGLTVSFYVKKKLQRYQLSNLKMLNEIYQKIKGDQK